MRIYTKAGDLAFKLFTFPDGQPHFSLETYEIDFTSVTVEVAIKSPSDLLTVLLVSDVLRQHGYTEVNLDIRYLMGARMDRAISVGEPFTLQIVSRLVNLAGFNRVRILDVHSEVATRLIRNSVNVLPTNVVKQAAFAAGVHVFVSPDKGAVKRTQDLTIAIASEIIYCTKERDSQTGALSGFRVQSPYDLLAGRPVMIVDDICDGGRTFVGLSKELKKVGASKVYLFVTHGIFSKGLPLEGIDHIYTTDSYMVQLGGLYDAGHYKGVHSFARTTVIPISMKELT